MNLIHYLILYSQINQFKNRQFDESSFDKISFDEHEGPFILWMYYGHGLYELEFLPLRQCEARIFPNSTRY